MKRTAKHAGIACVITLLAALTACHKDAAGTAGPQAGASTAAVKTGDTGVDLNLTLEQQETLLAATSWTWRKVVADPVNKQFTAGQDLTDMPFTNEITGLGVFSGDHRFFFTNKDSVKTSEGYWKLYYQDGKLKRTLKGVTVDGMPFGNDVDLVTLNNDTFTFRLEYPAGSGDWVQINHKPTVPFTANGDSENPFQAE